MPSLDVSIFGECQALLFNFEDLLTEKFGTLYALNESLSLALQFSRARSEQQDKAVKRLHRPLAKGIASYMEAFRSSLSAELLQDQRFSYKVFLIPKLANHERSADVAVEFVKYDPLKPEEMARYSRLVSLIKPSATAAVDSARPGVVSIRIVDNPGAAAARVVDYDDSHPNRQKELIAKVNGRLPGGVSINAHDIVAIRHAFNIDSEGKYFHKARYGSPQYSDLFADWIVQSYESDQGLFNRASREISERSKGGFVRRAARRMRRGLQPPAHVRRRGAQPAAAAIFVLNSSHAAALHSRILARRRLVHRPTEGSSWRLQPGRNAFRTGREHPRRLPARPRGCAGTSCYRNPDQGDWRRSLDSELPPDDLSERILYLAMAGNRCFPAITRV